MYFIALLQGYEAVHLSNNNFPKLIPAQVAALVDTLTSLRNIKTAAKAHLQSEVIKLMEAI